MSAHSPFLAPLSARLISCRYWLPEHITPHIDYITPGVKHGVYKRTESQISKREIQSNAIVAPPVQPIPAGPDVDINVKTVPQNCSSYVVDGDCIRALYNMPAQNNNRKVSSTNALGMFLLLDGVLDFC